MSDGKAAPCKQADLSQDGHLLDAIIDNTLDAIYVKDLNGRYIRANRQQMQRLGVEDFSELEGRTDAEFITGKAAESSEFERQAVATGEVVFSPAEKEVWKDGTAMWFTTTTVPLKGADGSVFGTFGVARNVTEVKDAEQKALEYLRELSESKSQFVAEASHELRTPLAIIREFVSLVHDGVAGPVVDKQKECLASALRNCDRMTELIDKMLDLTRIEAGKVVLKRAPTDILPLLREIHLDFAPKCASVKQQLTLDIPASLPAVHCDLESIRKVLINLVGNAVKYTPNGGSITMSCRHEKQFVDVCVKDTGVGIPADLKELIFEPFFQVDRQDGPGAKGTGLGLAIAKNLVTLNKGVMSVDSEPDQGSRFCFTLPVYDKGDPYRILIVDDDALVIRLIEQSLKRSDLHIDLKSTTSGLDSLVIAGQFNPNLIILDYHLSEMAGDKILASLRQTLQPVSGKVLMISGDEEALNIARASGIDDCLIKPFASGDLVRKVVTLLGVERRRGR